MSCPSELSSAAGPFADGSNMRGATTVAEHTSDDSRRDDNGGSDHPSLSPSVSQQAAFFPAITRAEAAEDAVEHKLVPSAIRDDVVTPTLVLDGRARSRAWLASIQPSRFGEPVVVEGLDKGHGSGGGCSSWWEALFGGGNSEPRVCKQPVTMKFEFYSSMLAWTFTNNHGVFPFRSATFEFDTAVGYKWCTAPSPTTSAPAATCGRFFPCRVHKQSENTSYIIPVLSVVRDANCLHMENAYMQLSTRANVYMPTLSQNALSGRKRIIRWPPPQEDDIPVRLYAVTDKGWLLPLLDGDVLAFPGGRNVWCRMQGHGKEEPSVEVFVRYIAYELTAELTTRQARSAVRDAFGAWLMDVDNNEHRCGKAKRKAE